MNRLLCTALLSVVVASSALAAGADEKPQLVSRTGGGKTWNSVEELQKAADKNDPVAIEAYGQMLLTGDQVKQDVPRALDLLERAAKAGQPNAAFRLGKVYDDGDPVPQDAAKAMTYYRQAAMAGVAEAQYNLGALLINGRGVKRDYREGLAWLIVAHKNGAEGDAEQQVRQRFQSTHREKLIADAEARAVDLQKEIAEKKNSGSSAGSK